VAELSHEERPVVGTYERVSRVRKGAAQDSGQGGRYFRERYDEDYRDDDGRQKIMSHRGILRILKAFKEGHASQYGILALGIFGSVARDESQESSDVDVVVKLKKQDLFNMIGIKQDLEEMLHLPVDVISYREQMNSFLKRRIDKESQYV
jgi:predicted nucleotidyltransferase